MIGRTYQKQHDASLARRAEAHVDSTIDLLDRFNRILAELATVEARHKRSLAWKDEQIRYWRERALQFENIVRRSAQGGMR